MILFNNIRIADSVPELLLQLKERIEHKVNLQGTDKNFQQSISQNMLLRLSFITGLSLSEERRISEIEALKLQATTSTIHDTVFLKGNLMPLWSAILKLRYKGSNVDLENATTLRKAINLEIKRGAEYLLTSDNLDSWLLSNINLTKTGAYGAIPKLSLQIGSYEDDISAYLDMNSTSISLESSSCFLFNS